MKIIIRLLVVFLPWKLRRIILNKFFGYEIHPSAKIGFAYIFPEKLIMMENSFIDHLNVAINMYEMRLDCSSYIGRSNWITGSKLGGVHFSHRTERMPCFFMGEHSAVTKNHIIDCTDFVKIGKYSTIAGYGSQILTHGINVELSIQDCAPVSIGDYCMIGSRVIMVSGSGVPDFSVVGAGAVVTSQPKESHCLYAGVPAKKIKSINEKSNYFNRKIGFVK